MEDITLSIRGKLDHEIIELISNKKKIGMGKNRVIYDLENGLVLKVVRTETGIRHNQREIHLYQSAGSPLKKHLAAILDYDELWLIMEKVEQKFPRSKKYRKKLKKLKSKFVEQGIDPIDMFDKNKKVKRKNLRINEDGRIIIIDYGAFKFRQ